MQNPKAKVAMVTGASRGIGKATALAFARAGFDVAIIMVGTQEEGQRSPYSVTTPDGKPLPGSLKTTLAELVGSSAPASFCRMDLLDPASVDAAVDRVLSEFGRIDVLINNAIYQGSDLNSMFLDLDNAGNAQPRLERICPCSVPSNTPRTGEHARTRRWHRHQRLVSVGPVRSAGRREPGWLGFAYGEQARGHFGASPGSSPRNLAIAAYVPSRSTQGSSIPQPCKLC